MSYQTSVRMSVLSLAGRLMLPLMLAVTAPVACALDAIPDDDLGAVTGEGLAIALTDYLASWGPTSYLEAVGTPITDAALTDFQFTRGDAYWYGGTYSSTASVRAWAGTCGAGIGNMGCPIGGTIAKFAPYDNPLLLRAFNYYQSPSGAQLLRADGTSVTSASPQTIFEVLGPTKQDFFKFSFWAEEQVMTNAAGGARTGVLQSQVIMGNSKLTSDVNGVAGNAKVRLFQTTGTDKTLGIIWENHFQGDFRFSVNQQILSPGVAGLTPMFSDYEGMYARNIKTYVPLGQLFYQALIFDDTVPGKNDSYNSAVNKGDFVIELTPLCSGAGCTPPAAVYNDFYGYNGTYTDGGAFTPQAKSARFNETHGYFYIGSIQSGVANNCSAQPTASSACIKDTTDGVFFHSWHPSNTSAQFNAFANRPDTSQFATYDNNGDPDQLPYACGNYINGGSCGTIGGANDGAAGGTAGFKLNTVNLGDVEIKGMLIQHLKITSLGAGG